MKLFKIFLLLVLCYNAQAEMSKSLPAEASDTNSGIANTGQGADDLVFKRSARVHRQGKLWTTITNYGKYANVASSGANVLDPETGKEAPMGTYPGVEGGQNQYIYSGSIWAGGYLETTDEAGYSKFIGPLVSTGGDGWNSGDTYWRWVSTDFAQDTPEQIAMYEDKKKIKESSTSHQLNYEDIDVFDPKASAEEQYTAWYTDNVVATSIQAGDPDTGTPFTSLGLEVKQTSYAWSYEYAEDFILIDFTVFNSNEDRKDIVNMFIGIYQDSDVGLRSSTSNSGDDISGFKKTFNFPDAASDLGYVTREINSAWTADNDGREFTGDNDDMTEPTGGPLDGSTGVTAVRVVRTPNPNLKLSFNWWNSNGEEKYDYGPRWLPGTDQFNGSHSDWAYDLTYGQGGYRDYDGADITTDANGPTEGTPNGTLGKYQVMSNGEFDYDQTDINATTKTPQEITDASGNVIATKQWENVAGISEEEVDDIANGYDTRFFLSFGPLGAKGTAKFKHLGTDGVTETETTDKEVYRLAYGDSVKMTVALIMGENFHTSVKNTPNNMQPNLYNFNDLANNALWAEKVYDNPLYDTPVTVDGKTRRDGWYGEDVGLDGLFAAKIGDQCWWASNAIYTQADEGENNGFLDAGEDEIARNGYTGAEQADDGNDLTVELGPSTVYGWQNPAAEAGDEYVRFGYGNEKLDAGDGLPDFKGPPSPPSPDLKVEYDGNDVIVKWASDNFAHLESNEEAYLTKFNGAPENYVDPFSLLTDFEGYQIWISNTASTEDAAKILEIDKIDYCYEDINKAGKFLPNGVDDGNEDIPTNLQLKGNIFPMTAEKRDSLVNAGLTSVERLNSIFTIRDLDVNNSYLPVNPILSSDPEHKNWEYSAETKTVDGNTYNVYSMRIKDRIKGKTFYVAVTSSDFGDPQSSTAPLTSNPANNMTAITPAILVNTSDPIVVPNPYRVDGEYEELGWEVPGETGWTEQDRKIQFMNIPENCIIRIYTAAGDIVRTLTHNGYEANQDGPNATNWDLINGNEQTVASGLYFYTVQDATDKDDVFVGKFAIIR